MKSLLNKRKLILAIVIVIVFSGIAFTLYFKEKNSNNTIGINSWSKLTLTNDTLKVKTGTNELDLQVCSPEILKVDYKPNGQEDPDTLVIDPDRKWDTGNIIYSDLNLDPAVASS